LTLNAAKTRMFDIRQEDLTFLGFTMRWRRSPRTGRHYTLVEPGAKARRKLHAAIRPILNSWTLHQSCTATVTQVNRVARGWSQYYHHGNCTRVFTAERDWLRKRLRRWLWRKYGRTLSRSRSSPMSGCMGSIGSSPCQPVRRISDSRTVNNPGKPDAGNPPVRFDEGREPSGGQCRRLAPAYSTNPSVPPGGARRPGALFGVGRALRRAAAWSRFAPPRAAAPGLICAVPTASCKTLGEAGSLASGRKRGQAYLLAVLGPIGPEHSAGAAVLSNPAADQPGLKRKKIGMPPFLRSRPGRRRQPAGRKIHAGGGARDRNPLRPRDAAAPLLPRGDGADGARR